MDSDEGFEYSDTPIQAIISQQGNETWNPCSSVPIARGSGRAQSLKEAVMSHAAERLSLYDFPLRRDSEVLGMEVGDDRVDISQNPLNLCVCLAAQEDVYKMKTSEKDTFISNKLWTFCEVTSFVPRTPEGSLQACFRYSFENLEFVDVPPIRIIIDCGKGDTVHSRSSIGKSEMLASRRRTPNPRHKFILELASLLQDGMLRTNRMEKPKYLPRILGGTGNEALLGNPRNTYLYVLTYRGGGYDQLYGTAVEEARTCLESVENGRRTESFLCRRLQQGKNYVNYLKEGDRLVLPKSTRVELGELMPLYKAGGITPLLKGVEMRLERAAHIIYESDACVELDRKVKLEEFLFGCKTTKEFRAYQESIELDKRRREGEKTALSVFRGIVDNHGSNAYPMLVEQGFLLAGTTIRNFEYRDALWLENGQANAATIEDLGYSEDVYLRSEVASSETLKVGGIRLNPQFTNRITKETVTTTRDGLWNISGDQLLWAQKVTEELVRERDKYSQPVLLQSVLEIYKQNAEWVRDDTLIIADAIQRLSTGSTRPSILISKDKRLAKQLSVVTNNLTLRVSPEMMIINHPSREWSSESIITLSDVSLCLPPELSRRFSDSEIYVDTGSFASVAKRYEAVKHAGHREKVQYVSTRQLVKKGIRPDGHRYQITRRKLLETTHIKRGIEIYHPSENHPVRPRSRNLTVLDSGSEPVVEEKSANNVCWFPFRNRR
jgi:hypothetical protein